MKMKSKFKKLMLSLASVACVCSAAFGVAGCMPKSIDKSEPTDKNVRNARLAPPTDGSLPTAYSAVENLAYVVGKFDSQTQYHSFTDGVTAASIATQTTRNWKDYKNGVLINSDLTFSSMVKGGTQTCTVFGEDEEGNPVADTYFRTSETPGADTTSTTAIWKQNAPNYFSENSYLYTYGFLPNELFNYAVNSDTVIDAEEIKVESNGTYTLTFNLDPQASTFFYQFGMKTRGGLSDYPDFQYIEITVNFDADWQINKSTVHEVSKVNKGILVDSVSDFVTVYSYDDAGFDNVHYGYYESYYKKYIGNDDLEPGGKEDDKLVMDVANVLSNGFATILNGGQQFEITANLGANKYCGYVFLGLDLADIAGSINLKLSLGKTLGKQDFYVEYFGGELSAYYGQDFGLYANLAQVKLEAEKFGEIIEKITSAIGGGTSEGESSSSESSSSSDPLTELMDSMVLVAGESQATLSLKTDDLLGMGIGIDANLVFGISGNTITFRGADVGGLALGGEVIDLSLGLKTTTASLIGHDSSQTSANLADYIADVYSLLNSDLIKVSASVNGNSDDVKISALKGVEVQLDAYANLEGIAVGADATASYTNGGNTVSATLGVIYEYNQNTGKYGNAYLKLKELNGTSFDFGVRCDIEQLVSGISALLNKAGAESSFETAKLVAILNDALSSDMSSLLTDMYADGTKIKIGVNIDTVMDMLGVNAGVKFGSFELAYQCGDEVYGGELSAKLNAIGFAMSVSGADGAIQSPDPEEYLDLGDILTDVKAFIDKKAAVVGLSFNGAQFTAVNIAELKDLTASATAYVDFNSGLAAEVVATVAYGNITAKITASYIYDSATYGTVVLTLNELCGAEKSVKIYCKIDEVVDGVKTLLTQFGTSTTAEETTNSAIDLSTVIANLLTADVNKLLPNLSASANVLNLTVNVDEVLKLLNLNIGMSVGEVALNYNHAGENLLSLTVPNFGVGATVNAYDGELAEVTTDDALNLKDVLDDVNAILNAKKVAVGLTFNGEQFTALNIAELKDLTASATAYVDFNSGLAAEVVAEVAYGSITAKITASYVYDSATYGTVVLTLNELCGAEKQVKIYCQIDEVVEGVKTLLTQFGTSTTAEEATNGSLDLSAVIANLLTADVNKLLPNLNASANVLNLTVNVDEVLNLLGVSLGNLSVGEVALNYNHAAENLLSLTVPNFGVGATVNAYDGELAEVTTDDALNLKDVLDDVNAILNAKKVAVGLSFNGAQFTAVNVPELKDLTASATAYVDFNTGLAAEVVAEVAYGSITAKITASYVYDSATYGTVVLTLNELCGEQKQVKIYCQINEVVDGVKTLLTQFGTSTTAEETTNGSLDLSAVIANLLTADVNKLLPNLSASANVLNLTVNVDEVLKLFNLNIGMSVGEVALNYNHAGENLLSLTVPNFGVGATVNAYDGELAEVTTDDALNLKDVLDDVNAILNAKKVAVGLSFNGAQFTAVNVPELKDLTASATAYVDFNTGLAAYVAANVSYKVGEQSAITASIKVYFNYDKNTVGDVAVVLDAINGVETSAKVYCNIAEIKTAIETLINYVTPKNDEITSAEEVTTAPETATAASVLEKLVNADFNALLKEIKASANTLNLTVDVDEILKLFDLNIGLSIGDVTLGYTHGGKNLLSANVQNFGLGLTVNTTTAVISAPAKEDCLDLAQLVNVVNGAISQINTIKTDGKLYFEIENGTDEQPATYLSLDGICVRIWGKGEISWAKGSERVALDLSTSISETGTDVTRIRLVYDKNASPMVKLALNDVGLEIYQEDVDGVTNGFIEIYNKLAGLFGFDPIEKDTAGQTVATESATTSTSDLGSADKLLAVIFGVLAQDDWVNFVNGFTATVNGSSVALGYLSDKNKAEVTIGTDGGLSLVYDGAFGERFTLGGNFFVGAAGEKPLSISFGGCNIASSKDGETAFIRLAYNYLFDCIGAIRVENILGSNTYAVRFELNGDNTEVAELNGVYVKADVYVTNEASQNYGKLAEGLLNIDVSGFALNLHVICEYDDFGKAQFYINLTRVGDVLLPDLKMFATQDSLYETFKVLFNTLNDTDVLEFIQNLLPASSENEVEQPSNGETVEQATLDKVAEILDKVINLNFAQAINAYEVGGVQYADIDLDNLFKQLGLNVGTMGSLAIKINHNNHSMTTSGVATVTTPKGEKEDREWISLSSEKTAKRSYSDFKREDYVNIEFLPYLLEDVVKFATDDNGKIYDTFTLSGNITASIVSLFDVNIDVANLTISLADNDFYFSATMHVKKVSALGLVTIPESTVGITYHGGYLTLARGLNTSTPEYRIMTMDFFIDHLLVKVDQDCVLKWWLNVSGWDTVISIINMAAGDLDISSGLTTPQDVYLYNAKKANSVQLISMYDYVDALKVMVNGSEYASFGDMSDLEKQFGITDNYYGFMLNAPKITGDVLTKLYAAIIRNDNGISAIKAAGAIDSYVTFEATLDYMEGASEIYQLGNALQSGTVAPSLYTEANKIIDSLGETVDYNHFVKKPDQNYDEKFGCYNLTYDSDSGSYVSSYDYSQILYSYTLTVVELDGTQKTQEVRYSSTVHLYDNEAPAYTDDGKQFRLLYSTEQGVIGSTTAIMQGDLTVYAVRAKAVNVVVNSGSAQYVITTFVGDKVPTTIVGLETIGSVTYANGTPVTDGEIITEELLNGSNTFELYGVFVQSVVEVDGINYKFTYDNQTSSGYYEVFGRAESFDTTTYCGANAKTLVLQSEIDGYPVVKIAANALAQTSGHSIKKVVVPASITTVGEKAFADNVGMQTVVFLAPEVTIEGSFSENEEGNTTPFYGCSAEADGTSTNLSVYYNTVIYQGSSSDLLWTKFRRSGSGAIYKRYYIGCDPRDTAVVDYDKNGGGSLYQGGWDYATAVAEVQLNGVENDALTVQSVQTILDRYYPVVTVGSFAISQDIEAKLAVEFAQFDMLKNGINYKCVYTTQTSVVNGYTQVTYNLTYTAATTINVYSGIEFTYYGTTVKANKATKITVPVSGESLTLTAPTAEGYSFLGYAGLNGTSLAFADWQTLVGANQTLYIVWGNSKVGAAFTSTVHTGGTSLVAPVGDGIDGKWYNGSWNEVTDISLDNLVVYTRSVFTLTIRLKRGGTDTNIVYVNGNTHRVNGQVITATSDVTSVTIYEGDATFTVSESILTVTTNGTVHEIYVNEASVTGKDKNKKRAISSDINGDISVTGNMSVTLSY